MIINASVGGTPGKDCGGFCKYCYLRTVELKNISSYTFGCKYCLPDHIGCDNCNKFINDVKNGFKPLTEVLSQLREILKWYGILGIIDNYDKMLIYSSADVINYPQLLEFVRELNDWGYHVHLGYTSGKGKMNEEMVSNLIKEGIEEVNFSVISTNPPIRKEWMRDEKPEEALKALKLLCENVDVNASTVAIPGVIDEEEIVKTCTTLEEWGVKSFLVNRFANFKYEGFVFNNRPIIEGMETQPYEEFIEMVQNISSQFSFRILCTPFADPETKGVPYMLSKRKYRDQLNRLPEVTTEATIITSKLSLKPLKTIFKIIATDNVNVIGVEKEIGDLITSEDLMSIDLKEVKNKVTIPGGALVHDKVAHEIFSRDGVERVVVRGPLSLFYLDVDGVDVQDALELSRAAGARWW